MSTNTLDLINKFSEQILSSTGEHTSFDQIDAFESAGTNSLVFIAQQLQFEQLNTVPAVIVTSETIAAQIKDQYLGLIISVHDARLAQALFKQHYSDYQASDAEWPLIHPQSIIHPSAHIGERTRVGPGAVIGENCHIADDVVIRANVVIEHNVKIGSASIINSLANIGYDCQLGRNVIVQSGCIIGNEGYGFATDSKNHHHRIPHTGTVVIEDDVHIGSNTCIDRGTYAATTIERGVKIDNLCHIAHNVRIGEDSLITAQCVIAGSSTIGKRVIASGQTGVLDHVTVADDVVLVQRAGVTQSIESSGMWAGTPAKPFKEYIKTLALTKKVTRLERAIKALQSQFSKS